MTTQQTLHIIIIDDEPMVLRMLQRLLQRLLANQDIQVQTFTDPMLAMSALTSVHAHLVITDYLLPRMNGLQVVQYIRTLMPTTPIMVLTGYGTPDLERRLREAGAEYVCAKPCSPSEMTSIFRTVFGATPA